MRCLTQQTHWQYSYCAQDVKGYLSSKIICVEHYTLIGLRVSSVFQYTHLTVQYKYSLKNHSAHQWASNTQSCIALKYCNYKKLFVISISTFILAIPALTKHKHSNPLFYFCQLALEFILWCNVIALTNQQLTSFILSSALLP